MKKTLTNWLKEFNEDQKYDIKAIIQDAVVDIPAGSILDTVGMGFEESEDAADNYFRDKMEPLANLCELPDSLSKIINNDTKFYTIELDDYISFDIDKYPDYVIIYDDLNEAKKDLATLENKFDPSIEDQMNIFNEKLGDYKSRIDIEVKEEWNNGGHFYSFNIYLDNMLIEDGIFGLDAEDMIHDIKLFDELKETLIETYGISINSIQKIREGFDRYYNIEMWKDGNTLERDIEIIGGQGMPRKLQMFLRDLDIDDILEEFKELDED